MTAGMGVHANGQVTYDVSEFSATYSKFVACVGVDASREANGSVKFNFLVSNDGTNWDSLQTTDILKGNNESVKISINIKDYKYFRVFVDKSIKLSGYTNILIGLVGIICSIVALLCGGITKKKFQLLEELLIMK